MIIIIVICGCVIIYCVYNLFRNRWVYKLRNEMIDEIYKYNMESIKNDTYDRNKNSFDDIPSYSFMLYHKFYKWNKQYFKAFIEDNR